MWSRYNVKHDGLRNFKANYWPCVAMALILGFSEGGGSSISRSTQSGDSQGMLVGMMAVIIALIGLALAVLVLAPLSVGCKRFFLVNQLQPATIDNVKYGFTSNYSNIVLVEFVTALFIALWSLLLIIPGIIKIYEYRMVDYILCEDPNLDYREAQARSKAMMMGNKMDAFIYDLSFIGWYLLGFITLGLGLLFYVSPYKASSDAALYIAIRNSSNVMSDAGSGHQSDNYAAADSEAREVEFETTDYNDYL